MVRQIPILGILLIVNGVLIGLMGILVIALGPFLYYVEKSSHKTMHPEKQTENMIFIAVLASMGALILVIAMLHVIAGFKCRRYRGRVFALVTVFTNILLLPTSCSVTSIGMLVYGLIVLFNNESIRAFEMGARGDTPEQIQQAFAPAPHYVGRERPWGGDYERWR
ncbi:MAG TPA: hypothetical protein VE988_11180 [Gemmataceae bacterium]|nr:hypothetical protein [Gemmataceae bacterium]